MTRRNREGLAVKQIGSLHEESLKALRGIMIVAEIWGQYPSSLENKQVKWLRPIVLFRSMFRVHARVRQN